jgi:EAL and modified HD-GYP domain-containing signal transduction protein
MDPKPVDVFVARQPIFDRQRVVAGYELLYRSGETNSVGSGDSNTITSVSLEHALLSFGLDTLTGGRDAWINASRHMLLRDHWSLLPAAHTVLELLETVEPTPDVIAACHRAKTAGYRLALDDFVYSEAYEPLLAIADFVKVDFRASDEAKRRDLARDLRRRKITILAEKVETEQEFANAESLGYSLYQGYFFCRPQMMKTRGVAPNRVGFLRLLREVHSPELDFDAIEALIEQDVALSLKLLRFLHTAAFGLGREISSIRAALMTLGERNLRKWVSLVAVFGLAQGKPAELVVVALTRARFAELLAPRVKQGDRATDLFLVGLLSVVDALTDQGMEAALTPLAISDEVRCALLEGAPPLGDVMHLVLAWERGQWDEAERWMRRLGVSEPEVAPDYADAVLWAEDHAQP